MFTVGFFFPFILITSFFFFFFLFFYLYLYLSLSSHRARKKISVIKLARRAVTNDRRIARENFIADIVVSPRTRKDRFDRKNSDKKFSHDRWRITVLSFPSSQRLVEVASIPPPLTSSSMSKFCARSAQQRRCMRDRIFIHFRTTPSVRSAFVFFSFFLR